VTFGKKHVVFLLALLGSATAFALAIYWLVGNDHVRPTWHRLVYGLALIAISTNGLWGSWVYRLSPRRAMKQFLVGGVVAIVVPLGIVIAPLFLVAALLSRGARRPTDRV
jgi:hypothetical protein